MKSTLLTVVITGSADDDERTVYLLRQPSMLSAQEFAACCYAIFGVEPVLVAVPSKHVTLQWGPDTWVRLEDFAEPQHFVQAEGPDTLYWRDFSGAERLARFAWARWCTEFARAVANKNGTGFLSSWEWRLKAIAKRWGLDAGLIADIKE